METSIQNYNNLNLTEAAALQNALREKLNLQQLQNFIMQFWITDSYRIASAGQC